MARGGKREGAGRKRGSKIPVRLPPVKAEIKQELRELAREYSGQALETLVKICESGENETARVAAANALLDRGYGKPSQHVDLAVTKYDSMSEAELRAHVEAQFEVLRLLDEGNGMVAVPSTECIVCHVRRAFRTEMLQGTTSEALCQKRLRAAAREAPTRSPCGRGRAGRMAW